MISFITCEISLGQYVCELVFGVNVFDLDLGVQIDSIEQPIKRISVGPGNMSHCGTSSLYDHLDHCCVVFKHIQQSFLMRRLDVWGKSTLSKLLITLWDCIRFWIVWGTERTSLWFVHKSLRACWLWFVFPRTATIRSHKSSAGIPSNRNPASKEMISDSVELCETEVCFLHIQLIGTNVWLPKTHNVPPEVDFESSRSPSKSESWNSPSLHCFAVFPTWRYVYNHMHDGCRRSFEIIFCHRLWSI